MRTIYRAGIATQNENMVAELAALPVWGKGSDFVMHKVCRDTQTLIRAIKDEMLDLLFIDTDGMEKRDIGALDRVKANRNSYIVFCGTNGDFEAAQAGIRLGIDDYFVLPFETDSVARLFNRIREGSAGTVPASSSAAAILVRLFCEQDKDLVPYTEELVRAGSFAQTADEAVHLLFQEYDWLDLYLCEADYLSTGGCGARDHRERFLELFTEYTALNPHHNESLDGFIRHILYNPESDLRQKNLSEEQHINRSYLSTVFTAQTELRFVDYITGVKLKRAAWLLKNTDMRVNEIAGRLDYKDIAYFSKQFKRLYGMTPSEYRLPDSYNFQI